MENWVFKITGILLILIGIIGGLSIPFIFGVGTTISFSLLFIYVAVGIYYAWIGWKSKTVNKIIYASAIIHLIAFIVIGIALLTVAFLSVWYADSLQGIFGFIIPIILLQLLGLIALVIGIVQSFVAGKQVSGSKKKSKKK